MKRKTKQNKILLQTSYSIMNQTTLQFLQTVTQKPYIRNKYLTVHLCKNNKPKHFFIHRLVAEAFIPNPDKKPQVNHINGIKTDNTVSNLEWVSSEENISHKYEVLGYKVSDKTKSKMSKSAFFGWQKRRLKCL